MSTSPKVTYVEIHLDPRTSLSKTMLLACKELELDERNDLRYVLRTVDLASKEHKSGRHLALHPFGKIPVMVTNLITLYEGQAILRYLANYIPPKCPSGRTVRLIPANHALRAQMDKLMSICPGYFKPAWFPMYKELVLKKRYASKDPVDEKVVEKSVRDTAAVLEVLELEMGKTTGGYFCGNDVSICDMYLFPEFLCLEGAGKWDELFHGKPLLNSWFQRMKARESYKKIIKYNIRIGHKYPEWRVCDSGKVNYVEVHLDPRTSLSKTMLLACKELELDDRQGVSYLLRTVDLASKEHKSDRHLKLHPFGKIPVLVTNETTLYEGQAILRYLATSFPSKCPSGRVVRLIPDDRVLEAHMNKLMSICPGYFKPAWFPMYKELVLKKRYASKEPADKAVVDKSVQDTAAVLEILEKEMGKTAGGFFCGCNVTLIDLYLFPEFLCLEGAGKFDELHKDKPLLRAWYHRMVARDSYQKILKYECRIGHKYPPWIVRDKPEVKHIKIHLDPRTSLSKTMLLTCKELELDARQDLVYELQTVDLATKEHKSDQHLKLHPFGKIPVLVTDTTTLYEGQAIMRFLADAIPPKCPSGKVVHLVPKNIALKAQMDKLMSICCGYFKPAWFPMYKELVLKKRYASAEPANEAIVGKSVKDTASVLGVLEMEIGKTAGIYFCGHDVSLCDLYLFPEFLCLEGAGKINELLKEKPLLRSWYQRMEHRDSYRTITKYQIGIGHIYPSWKVTDPHSMDFIEKKLPGGGIQARGIQA